MKAAHIISIGPHRSGLYESARTLIAGERKCGIDGRMVPYLSTTKMDEDRGVPIADEDFAEDADVIVSHSGTSMRALLKGTPIVSVLHGNPEYSFHLDLENKVESFYSVKAGTYHHDIYKAFVTFYPQHIPYWNLILPEDKIRLINPPCDLDVWNPQESSYDFHGKGGEINVVCTDTWRVTKIPYDIIHGFSEWARNHPNSKIHFYGTSVERLPVAWTVLMKGLERRGLYGECMTWSKHLDEIYSTADMLITPARIATRTMREAMACGCPVVSHTNSLYSEEQADTRNPEEFASAMERLWNRMENEGRGKVRGSVRNKAEQEFDGDKSAETFSEILEHAASQERTQVDVATTWYDKGLQFKCEKCGRCCRNGVVRMTADEVGAVSEKMNLEIHQIIQIYGMKRYGGMFEITCEGACPFLNNNKCSIQDIKPRHCSTYPFWPENTETPDAWNHAALTCPGIGSGEKHDRQHVIKCVNDMRQIRQWYISERAIVEDSQEQEVADVVA